MENTTINIKKINEKLENLGIKVAWHESVKNNSLCQCLKISSETANTNSMMIVHPSDCETFDELIEKILYVHDHFLANFDFNSFLNKKYILDNVGGYMVSGKSTILNNVVHHDILDMSLIYFVRINPEMTFKITPEILDIAGIQEDELFNIVSKKQNFLIGKLTGHGLQFECSLNPDYDEKFLDEHSMEFSFNMIEDPGNKDTLYVISTPEGLYGSLVLCCEEFLKKVVHEIGPILIFPSSIDEVLYLPDKDEYTHEDYYHFSNIVKAVNSDDSVIPKDKILTNSLYRFSIENGLEKVFIPILPRLYCNHK